MNGQRIEALEPAPQPGGFVTVKLANDAALKGRELIIATGARWRNVNVPGEAEYRSKGVAYCPHCDGPLFKGKRVAVIGAVKQTVIAAGEGSKAALSAFDHLIRSQCRLMTRLMRT